MAKKTFRWGFYHWAFLYALLLLIPAFFGLRYLWNYAAAYEMARPYHAIDAYMADLTPEYICQRSSDLIATVDRHIQSEEACRQVISEAVSGSITYAKKSSECTDEKMVYILRTGNQVIGRVELVPEGEAVMGFVPWAFSSDSYDLSYLLTGTVSATVPAEFPVYVNGAKLTERYITEDGIQYSNLKDYYGEYSLPTIVSYTAGPCLGDIIMEITDTSGNPVQIDGETDLNIFLDNCSQDTKDELGLFLEDFVHYYVRFTNSNSQNRYNNYYALTDYVANDSALAKRCQSALGGMAYGSAQRYQIRATTINWCTDIGEGRYLCDITYVVDIRVSGEMVENVFNSRMVIVETQNGLKAETLRNY